MHHQNKGERVFVFILLFLCIFICIICTHCVYVYFIYLYLFKNTWPILVEGIGAVFGAHFLEKVHFVCTLPKQIPFLTISNKNIFFKTRGKRLGAVVAPNKRLE